MCDFFTPRKQRLLNLGLLISQRTRSSLRKSSQTIVEQISYVADIFLTELVFVSARGGWIEWEQRGTTNLSCQSV